MRKTGADALVIARISNANCVIETAIDGNNAGYKIVVLADTTTEVPFPKKDVQFGYMQR